MIAPQLKSQSPTDQQRFKNRFTLFSFKMNELVLSISMVTELLGDINCHAFSDSLHGSCN